MCEITQPDGLHISKPPPPKKQKNKKNKNKKQNTKIA